MSRFSLSVRPTLTGALMLLSIPTFASGERLLSFEQAPASGEKLSGWNATVTRTQLSATDGVFSVRQDVPANLTGYATFEFAGTRDMSACGTLITDVYNAGNEDATIWIYLIDANKKTVRIETVVPAGRWVHPGMILRDRRKPSEFGLRDLPRVSPEARLMTIAPWNDTGCDLATVKQVQIVVKASAKPQQVYFDYFRTTPSVDLNALTTRWIDAYGQNVRVNWASKIKADADLTKAKADEDRSLAKMRAITSYDAYGADVNTARPKATGFFRVEKQKTGWKMFAPNGNQFWSLGVNSVSILDEGASITGKEQMFESLPSTTGSLSSAYTTRMVNGSPQTAFSFVKANMIRKYGAGRNDLWYGRAIERMKKWGLNTVGAFSDREMLPLQAMPTTPKIGSYGAANIAVPLLPGEPMPDPYAPTFSARLMDNMWRVRPNDPMIVGYFVDNILPFSANYSSNYKVALPLAVLELNSASSAAKAALVAKLQDQYGTIGALNAAWNTGFGSWGSLASGYRLADRSNTALVNATMFADLRAYLKDFARKYFSIVRTTLKTADPNHLYLGSRLEHPDADILGIMGEYADVVSVNIYQYNVTDGGWSILKDINRPVMISEFGFNSYERGVPGMFVEVANEAERAAAFKNFVTQCHDMTNVVGAHIYQFQDQNPHGAAWMNENCNNGFVDVTDSPYPEMVAASRTLASSLYPTPRFSGLTLGR